MGSIKSKLSILGLTFISLILFQNCGDADFNVEDFNSEAPAPVVQADPEKPTLTLTNASASIFTGANANIKFSVDTKDEFYYELSKGSTLLSSDTLPAGTVTYPIRNVTPTSAGVYNILITDVNDNEVTASYKLTVKTRPAPAITVSLSQTYGTCTIFSCYFGTSTATKTLKATASTSAPASSVRWTLNNVPITRCNSTKTCSFTASSYNFTTQVRSGDIGGGTHVLKATGKTDAWGALGSGTKSIVVTTSIMGF